MPIITNGGLTGTGDFTEPLVEGVTGGGLVVGVNGGHNQELGQWQQETTERWAKQRKAGMNRYVENLDTQSSAEQRWSGGNKKQDHEGGDREDARDHLLKSGFIDASGGGGVRHGMAYDRLLRSGFIDAHPDRHQGLSSVGGLGSPSTNKPLTQSGSAFSWET